MSGKTERREKWARPELETSTSLSIHKYLNHIFQDEYIIAGNLSIRKTGQMWPGESDPSQSTRQSAVAVDSIPSQPPGTDTLWQNEIQNSLLNIKGFVICIQ